MRLIPLVVFILFTSIAFGQSKVENAISTDVCDCLSQLTQIEADNLVYCFETAVSDNAELISKVYAESHIDTSFEAGEKYGREIYAKLSVSMIYSCESYFKYMEDLRETGLKDLNKDSIDASISKMNESNTDTWNDEMYTTRGLMYFKVGAYNSAIIDFDHAIKINNNAMQSIFFKAWSLEKLKKYDEAYLLYKKIATVSGENTFNVFAAIVEHKKRKQSD